MSVILILTVLLIEFLPAENKYSFASYESVSF